MEKGGHHARRRRPGYHSKAISVEIAGLKNEPWRDLYHYLLSVSWPGFITLVSVFYFASHFVFAGLYYLDPHCIESPFPGTFRDAFFFSVQTMATIGYGRMVPANTYGDILVSIEALYGLLTLTMITGLMFAKFSRPSSKVMFSRNALVTTRERHPVFMFRIANSRGNQIVEAHMSAMLAYDDTANDSEKIRRLHEIKLERQHSPLFALSWTAVHKLTDQSPLHGKDHDWWLRSRAEVIVSVTGLDETFGQTIYARHSYSAHDTLWNRRFVDIIREEAHGGRVIDYTHFHDTVDA